MLTRHLAITGNFTLNYMSQIKLLFHKNLQSLEYDSSSFRIGTGVKWAQQRVYNPNGVKKVCNRKTGNVIHCNYCPNLNYLYYHVIAQGNYNPAAGTGNLSIGIQLLQQFDCLFIRRSVKSFRVDFAPIILANNGSGNNNSHNNNNNRLNDPRANGAPSMDNIEKIFCNKLLYDEIVCPSIENIIFEIDDFQTLVNTAKYLVWISETYKSQHLIKLRTFEIQWKSIKNSDGNGNTNVCESKFDHEIFNVELNRVGDFIYCGDKIVFTKDCKHVDIYNCDLQMKTVGALYTQMSV